MTRWLVSVPVWGERYVEEFCAAALPALERAVACFSADLVRPEMVVVVHTDQPQRVCSAATQTRIDARPVPAGLRDFDCMSQAHREVARMACRGDVVVFLTAGAVISERGLAYCADVLDNRQIAVVLCAVPRVLQEGQLPSTDDAQAFMAWAWQHRHPMTRECTWPVGCSTDLSRTFFARGRNVVTRQCLPHPLAVRVDGRPLGFTPTVDANLIQCFDPIEMHIAQDCRELALIKLSPADKGYDLSPRTMEERARDGGLVITDGLQRWCMSKRIALVGDPRHDCGDEEFVSMVRGG